MEMLLILFFFVLLAGAALLWLGRRGQRAGRLPLGEVAYSDTGAEEQVEAPLISRRYGIIGRPDYLLHSNVGGKQIIIPVEVKSRRRPTTIYENHTLQLGAYCLLVEERFGATPPYGLLRYADATLQVPFNERLRSQVLEAVAAIRRAQQSETVHRQHREPQRCLNCGYRYACGEEIG